MMQVIPKWTVTVHRAQSQEPVSFGFSDFHAANVLTAIAKMDFGMDVTRIEIALDTRVHQSFDTAPRPDYGCTCGRTTGVGGCPIHSWTSVSNGKL